MLDLEQVERRARAFGAGVERTAAHVVCAYPFKANPMAAVTTRAVGVYGHAEVATVEELELATTAPVEAPAVLVGGIAKIDLHPATRGGARSNDQDRLGGRARTPAARGSPARRRVERPAAHRAAGGRRLVTVRNPAGGRDPPGDSGEPWTRRLRGVHFHAGTALSEPTPFVDATEWCAPVLQAIERLDHVERACLDIGGGYPNVADDDVEATAERYLGAVADALTDAGCDPPSIEFVCEPGRITVERAGVLVATVVERAPRAAGGAVVVDAGSTLAGGSWAPVRSGRAVVHWEAAAGTDGCDVYGNLCHEGDLVAEGARLEPSGFPASTALIGDVGAYRLSAAAPWMQQLPAVYELRDGALAVLRPALPLAHFT